MLSIFCKCFWTEERYELQQFKISENNLFPLAIATLGRLALRDLAHQFCEELILLFFHISLHNLSQVLHNFHNSFTSKLPIVITPLETGGVVILINIRWRLLCINYHSCSQCLQLTVNHAKITWSHHADDAIKPKQWYHYEFFLAGVPRHAHNKAC